MTTEGFSVAHARDAQLARGHDVEMLEIVMPAEFATELVPAVTP